MIYVLQIVEIAFSPWAGDFDAVFTWPTDSWLLRPQQKHWPESLPPCLLAALETSEVTCPFHMHVTLWKTQVAGMKGKGGGTCSERTLRTLPVASIAFHPLPSAETQSPLVMAVAAMVLHLPDNVGVLCCISLAETVSASLINGLTCFSYSTLTPIPLSWRQCSLKNFTGTLRQRKSTWKIICEQPFSVWKCANKPHQSHSGFYGFCCCCCCYRCLSFWCDSHL